MGELIKKGILPVLAGVLIAPGTAWAYGYNFGPGIAFLPFLMFWPVVGILLACAYGFRRQTGWRRGLRRLGLTVGTTYVVLYGLIYPRGMRPDGYAGTEAIFLSAVLFGTILAIWLCVLAPGRRRRLVIGATIGAFLVVNLLTPRVIRFHHYEPFDNPLPEPDGTMRVLTSNDAQLSDGRHLRFDRLNTYVKSMPVFLEELSPAQVEVSVVRSRRIPRRLKALVDLRWIKVREEKHEIVTLGVGQVLEDDWVPAPDAVARVLFYTSCQPDYIAEALRRGADPNATVLGSPALHFAAEKSCPEVVELLLAAGADVNGTNSSGQTPLHRAANALGTLRILELLIEAGADVELESRSGYTALDIARARFGPGGSEAWREEAPATVATLEAAAIRPREAGEPGAGEMATSPPIARDGSVDP